MGNIAVTNVKPFSSYMGGEQARPGALKAKLATLTMSNSYATGGDSIDSTAMTALGLTVLTGIDILSTAVKTWAPQVVAGKVVLTVLGTGAELAAAQDGSTMVMTCMVYGY